MEKKITSRQDLEKMREEAKHKMSLRGEPKDIRITVHMGTCGIAAGARDVLSELISELGKSGVRNATIQQTGCAGLCDQEPMLTLTDKSGGMYRYGKLDARKIKSIVREHVIGGVPVENCLIGGRM